MLVSGSGSGVTRVYSTGLRMRLGRNPSPHLDPEPVATAAPHRDTKLDRYLPLFGDYMPIVGVSMNAS